LEFFRIRRKQEKEWKRRKQGKGDEEFRRRKENK
jgi:hypothetical protein